MTASVAGEKEDAAASEFAFDDFIGWHSEGGFDRMRLDDFKGVDFVKAGAADDGERGCAHG